MNQFAALNRIGGFKYSMEVGFAIWTFQARIMSLMKDHVAADISVWLHMFSLNSFSYRGSYFKYRGQGSQVFWIRCRGCCRAGCRWRCRLMCVWVKVFRSRVGVIVPRIALLDGLVGYAGGKGSGRPIIEARLWAMYDVNIDEIS